MRMSCSKLMVHSAPLLLLALLGCSSSSEPQADRGGNADQTTTRLDAHTDQSTDTTASPGPDGGSCVPGAKSLVCANATTVSWCTEDTNFDGKSDGPPRTVAMSCAAFFNNAGAASCEIFNAQDPQAQCTMDDGGPCGVILVTGQATSARCTSDDAVCLLNLEAKNYLCTPNTGLSCTPGKDFKPYCSGNLLVWRCSEDGDGQGQAYVDDCAALGEGRCDAVSNTCVGIKLGGTCDLESWICDGGLKCDNKTCVTDPG